MFVFMSVVVTVLGSVGTVLKMVFLALECCSMLCACVADMMDAVFSVCIMRLGAEGACVWEV